MPTKPNTLAPFSAADLPIDDQGRIYHLQVRPEEIARDILIVGDPGRAEFIGEHFMMDIESRHQHRGLVTITGTAKPSGKQATIISPLRTTVATSGMGTASLEIVVNELVLLNEIDFTNRTRKRSFPRLHVIRVGTSGGLQESTKLGTPIIATHAIGMDNTSLYYETPKADDNCQRLEEDLHRLIDDALPANSRNRGKIHPYVSQVEPILVEELLEAARSLGITTKEGITVSAPGFFGPQGRATARVKPSVPELDKLLAEFDPQLEGLKIENMEMEAGFLVHFLGGLGYWAGAICPAIANRRLDTFDPNYQEGIKHAINIALLALANLRRKYPDVQLVSEE